jgi:3-hydroxyanthranilate 3,4-dioxygenase
MIQRAFNLQKWVDDHRDLLKPPVGNKQVYIQNDDFIVMIVGGPNARKDYHYEDGEELFYQIEGDIVVKIIEDGKPVDIPIRQGEMFLLPPHVPHSPQRPANTVGLVIERYRTPKEKDSCMWFCEQCHQPLHQTEFTLTDIEQQLPVVLQQFYDSEQLRTCQQCGTVMQPPVKLA